MLWSYEFKQDRPILNLKIVLWLKTLESSDLAYGTYAREARCSFHNRDRSTTYWSVRRSLWIGFAPHKL